MASRLNVLVTGCASGIGRHLAGAFARRGHQVLATDLDEAGLAGAAADGWDPERVRRSRLDVRQPLDWERALDLAEEAGAIDVVLNVAGVLKPGYVADVTPADIDLHVDVNVKGVMLGTSAAARRMLAVGRGHIVNFGSLASLVPVAGLGLYSATKFAVRGFSLAAAQELRGRGVAVSVVLPDAVQTPMLDLQVRYDEAAMTFSGDRPLTVVDIERVLFDRVLPARPFEVALPPSRALVSRLATALPAQMMRLAPFFIARGRKRQAEARRQATAPARPFTGRVRRG